MKKIILAAFLTLLGHVLLGQNQNIRFHADAGLNFSGITKLDYHFIGFSGALRVSHHKLGIGLRLRGETWFSADKSETDYLQAYTGVVLFRPSHYEVFAIEAYKRIAIKNQKLYCGMGAARVFPYYMYEPKIDTLLVPGTSIKTVSFAYQRGPRYFLTFFTGIPIQWLYIEARVKIPISTAQRNSTIARVITEVVPNNFFTFSLYVSLPRKYYKDE